MTGLVAAPANGRSAGGRGWLAGGIGGALLLLLASWFLVIGPTRSDAADLRDSTADVQTQNTVLTARVAELKEAAEQRGELAAQLRAALDGLPTGPHLPIFSRQLTAQAEARGVVMTGFSVGAPTDPTTGGATAADPAAAPASTLVIPITVTSTGAALDQLYFLRDIQQVGPRLALVTSTSLTPGQAADDSASIETSSTLTVQLSVFTHDLPRATRDQLAELLGSAASN